MEIKESRIELIDIESRLVLKRIITDKGEFFSRSLAVSNSLYSCERKRVIFGKSLFDSIFQTFHLMWNSKEEEWVAIGYDKAKKHAEENNRFFISYKQRNEEQWDNLDWNEAEKEFSQFLDRTKIVPFPIPLTATIQEWKEQKEKAKKILSKGQTIMAIFSSKHLNITDFPLLIKEELKDSNFLGICCYELSSVLERTNLSLLNSINASQKEGEKTSLIVYFDYPRILTRQSNIAGSFAFNCFVGDVFSEKAYFPQKMHKDAIEEMLNKKPKDYYLYDIKEKKFTKSLQQEAWHGFDLTNGFMERIAVSEGLSGYNAIKWVNYLLQQRDLRLINKILLSKRNVLESIKNYTGWGVFWNTLKPNIPIIQKTL
jgi:hypothetical protein